MNTVLYFQTPAKTSAPEKLTGVREIMGKQGLSVQVIEDKPTTSLVKRLNEFWSPIGAIVDCGGEYNDLDADIFTVMPTVFIGHAPDSLPARSLHVFHDQSATAKLAARELLQTGYANFAFVPSDGKRAWSDAREKAFRDAITLNGKRCAIYEPPAKRRDALGRIGLLRNFLVSLEKPCAAFAANDKTGADVLAAARLAKISVPNELAVIGVDNYEPVCEHTSPPLTSIEPDFRRGGAIAALMLLAVTSGNGVWHGERSRSFGPMRVVRRASSRILFQQDPQAIAALDLIRHEACSGLRAQKVAALFTCSRRMADIRFARATGRTILSEIHAVQLERAKHLLENSNMPLKAISDFCGFTHPNSIRKFFLKETGMTMSAWRQRD